MAGSQPPKSAAEAKAKVQEFLNLYQARHSNPEDKDWSAELVPHFSLVSLHPEATYPRIVFRMTVQPIHANAMRNMHGGCTATIFDILTSMVFHLVSRPGFWTYAGVSRTLNVTYLRPIPVGTVIDIDCELLHAGQRLAQTRAVIRAAPGEDGKPGPILASCEHGKVNTDPKM